MCLFSDNYKSILGDRSNKRNEKAINFNFIDIMEIDLDLLNKICQCPSDMVIGEYVRLKEEYLFVGGEYSNFLTFFKKIIKNKF